MNFIQLLLLERLRNKNLQHDMQGSDRRILSIVSQDLADYLSFHWKLTDLEKSQHQSSVKMRKYLREKPEEFREFLDVWCGIWAKKWNQRVKLVAKTTESQRLKKNRRRLSQVEPAWRLIRNRSEIKDIVVEALIRNGEICGASILAEHLLKTELASRMERRIRTNGLENLLDITNRVLARARCLSRSKGKTIFIIVEKSSLVNL
jgi:hypothetical protein